MAADPVAGVDQGAIPACLEQFRTGELTEDKLRHTLEQLARGAAKRQDLLYLQTQGSSLGAAVHGMALVRDGEILEGPPTLMLDESRTYGLGCEFILEKWE